MSKAIVLLLLVVSMGCGSTPPKAVVAPQSTGAAAEWDGFVHDFVEGALADDPGFAVSEGRHEYDGQVADVSAAGIAKTIARLRAARDKASAFLPDALDEGRRFEREYVLATLDGSLFWYERARQHEKSPLVYSGAIDPSVYLTREYAPLAQRLDAYVRHLQAVPRVVEAMKANLRLPLPRTFVDVGLKVFGGLGSYLADDVPALFAAVTDEARQRALREATAVAVSAVRDATTWLEAQQAGANDAFALGPDLFREMLWATERVDTPLEKLEAVGRADMEQNLAALTQACVTFAPGKSLQECAERVANEKPSDGPVLGARAQLGALKRFLLDQNVVSIPGDEEARVEEAPPYKRWNAAYIEIPGPFEQGMPSIYYIAPPDPTWSEADRLAYVPGQADLLFISVHEVWPGHFLQYLHAKRSDRMFGRLFVGYAFAEGWAHYAEEMMWQAGLHQGDAQVHVGQLLNALLRDARFLSAIGLHTRGMTVAESESLFRDKAFCDAGNAKQQAARGTFDPAYLNYTLGKLMIRKMRDDYTASRGGRAAWRDFHDRFLAYGGPPLPLVRRALVGDASALF